MAQKYGGRANAVKSAWRFECLICRSNPTTWTWTDLHGEAVCVKCGTPYQLLQYAETGDGKRQLEDKPPRINIRDEWLPVLIQYWQERQAFMGLGRIMIDRQYPEFIVGKEKFYAWCDAHEDILPSRKEE